LLQTSYFLSFALRISIDESQSTAQFNTLSLGENKTDVYRAENIDFFSKNENFKKSPHLFTLIFIPS